MGEQRGRGHRTRSWAPSSWKGTMKTANSEGEPSWRCATYVKGGSIRWDYSHQAFVIRQLNNVPQKYKVPLSHSLSLPNFTVISSGNYAVMLEHLGTSKT